jgi:hypothetical protein
MHPKLGVQPVQALARRAEGRRTVDGSGEAPAMSPLLIGER